jgi:uncharacterized RDD family membrane protein YckC
MEMSHHSAPASTLGAHVQDAPAGAPAVYAGFWLRFAAGLIDCLAMFIPFCWVVLIVIVIARLVSAREGYDPGAAILAVLPPAIIVVTWLYFAVMESSSWQATLGKPRLARRYCGYM